MCIKSAVEYRLIPSIDTLNQTFMDTQLKLDRYSIDTLPKVAAMASSPPPSSPPHRLNLIELTPNQIEWYIEIIPRSFIHCLIRLLVANWQWGETGIIPTNTSVDTRSTLDQHLGQQMVESQLIFERCI